MRKLERVSAAIITAIALSTTATGTAHATTEASTCAGQPLLHSGSTRADHTYTYTTLDPYGVLRTFYLTMAATFDWCIDTDGDRFIRTTGGAFTHRDSRQLPAVNVTAFDQSETTFVGAYPDRSTPIAGPSNPHAWVVPGVWSDNAPLVSKWAYSDTRWVQDYESVTIQLSPGQRFYGCPALEGKWVTTVKYAFVSY